VGNELLRRRGNWRDARLIRMPQRNHSAALSLKNVSKTFDQQKALINADFSVDWGELHALRGENGAGKSTLMNVVCGLYTADDGQVRIDGRQSFISDPQHAGVLGVGMVHQHFKLIESFTVAENLLLSCGDRVGISSLSEISKRAKEVAESIEFSIDVESRISSLSVAERQRIEITKLMLLGADILILDEPTAVLTDQEASNVLGLLRRLASRGKAVVLITHRLNEVIEFADRVTVMRSGETVIDGVPLKGLTESDLAIAMVGEGRVPVESVLDRAQSRTTKIPRLKLQEVSIKMPGRKQGSANFSFEVAAGEVLGIAGVGGNGQTELTQALIGLIDIESGSITVDQDDLSNASITKRRQHGLRLIPADRAGYALIPDLQNFENLALTKIATSNFGGRWWLSRRVMRQNAKEMFRTSNITGGTINSKTRLLSGGNAQKLLLARELDTAASVLIAHSPTRGLDIRAYAAVHEVIRRSVANGAACLLISEDLDEVLTLSSRVGVMSREAFHGPFHPSDLSRSRIGELMAGHV